MSKALTQKLLGISSQQQQRIKPSWGGVLLSTGPCVTVPLHSCEASSREVLSPLPLCHSGIRESERHSGLSSITQHYAMTENLTNSPSSVPAVATEGILFPLHIWGLRPEQKVGGQTECVYFLLVFHFKIVYRCVDIKIG